MRKKIIAGNWKMNHNFNECVNFINEVKPSVVDNDPAKVEMLIAPSFVFIKTLKDMVNDSQIMIGSQDVSSHEKGAYTGEISVSMLNSIKCDFSIIGHSERRSYHHESNSLIREKLQKLIDNNIRPIVCIGETLEQREKGITNEIILQQLSGCFADIDLNNNTQIVIAYEPIWAIGTGKTATPEMAQEVHHNIRLWIEDNYNKETAEKIHILYGGSVKPANIEELLSQKDIDGGLIGGAALKSESYIEMVRIANK